MTSQSDHRSRVGAERRERMRMRLIESALLVFATQGLDNTVIENVIGEAQVSRGTFYNYFKTNEELLGAVIHELGNELFAIVDTTLIEREDPAERLACALRMILHTAVEYPKLARFAAKMGLSMTLQDSLALVYLPRDILAGMEQGRFAMSDPLLGIDLVTGTIQAAIFAIAWRPGVPSSYPEDITYHVLQGLGMTKASARRLVQLNIESVELPANALLSRTQPMQA